MKFEILEYLDHPGRNKEHKINLIGRPYQKGELENLLDIKFESEDRVLADQAFEQLKADAYIRPTYGDIASPELWVEITDKGRQAIERPALDDFDEILGQINPHLLEIRDGAWAALAPNKPDTIRQAAHSGRELIDQFLKESASDEMVKSQSDFVSDSNSRSGVTRRHRLKFLMGKYKSNVSESDLKIIEKNCELVIALDDKLKEYAHSRTAPLAQDVSDALQSSEMALRRILL
jgi:hypothetical protein